MIIDLYTVGAIRRRSTVALFDHESWQGKIMDGIVGSPLRLRGVYEKRKR